MHLYKLRFKNKGTVTANAIAVPFAFSSFNLLFQFIKLRRGEKLAQSDAQSIANHLDCNQLRILALPVKNVLDARRRQSRDGSQLVDGDLMFTAQCQNTISDRSNSIHALPPPDFLLIAYPIWMDFIGYTCYY